jgi:predicted transcriptional regulator
VLLVGRAYRLLGLAGSKEMGVRGMRRLPRGELESQVLHVLWAADGPCTPRQVQEALGPDRDLAYTTVMTILVRLWQKGLLEREPSGRTYTYRPVESRDERVANRMRELLAGAGDRAAALTGFVESLPADELDDLRRILDRAEPDP